MEEKEQTQALHQTDMGEIQPTTYQLSDRRQISYFLCKK